jgi:hypothetical protein
MNPREGVRRVATKAAAGRVIGAARSREISKRFNLFEAPRLLIVPAVPEASARFGA